MAVLQLKCPHCHSMSQLRVIGFAPFPFDPALQQQEVVIALGMTCPGCHNPVCAVAKTSNKVPSITQHAQYVSTLHSNNGIGSLITAPAPIQHFNLSLVEYWPKAAEPAVPDHLPDPVAKAFLQAERNFPLVGHEEAAGSMYRRALEVALSIKYPNLNGTLAQRIKKLVDTNVLTKELGEWSDGIRLIGNDAAHADEVTAEDLKMARAFTDAVLRYTFTLPEQVRLREVGANK